MEAAMPPPMPFVPIPSIRLFICGSLSTNSGPASPIMASSGLGMCPPSACCGTTLSPIISLSSCVTLIEVNRPNASPIPPAAEPVGVVVVSCFRADLRPFLPSSSGIRPSCLSTPRWNPSLA